MNPDLKELTIFALEQKGFDGLYDGDGCGCDVSDLFPCGDPPLRCRAGYLWNKKQLHKLMEQDYEAYENLGLDDDYEQAICDVKPESE